MDTTRRQTLLVKKNRYGSSKDSNVTSPIRQDLFERECDIPLLEARYITLLLLGLDASQPANALPEEHQEHYRILHDAISRTIKATGMVSAPANKRMFYADEMFALAWRLIDDELTPPEIKARSLKAVMKLSRNSRGRKWLKTLGDDALSDLTVSAQPSLRGCINATRYGKYSPILLAFSAASGRGRYTE